MKQIEKKVVTEKLNNFRDVVVSQIQDSEKILVIMTAFGKALQDTREEVVVEIKSKLKNERYDPTGIYGVQTSEKSVVDWADIDSITNQTK